MGQKEKGGSWDGIFLFFLLPTVSRCSIVLLHTLCFLHAAATALAKPPPPRSAIALSGEGELTPRDVHAKERGVGKKKKRPTMDALNPMTEAQRLQEEQEIRERDRKRQLEKEERERRAAREREEAERKRREEAERLLEEEKRRIKQEEEWRRLGTDTIQNLPPVPPSIVSDGLVQAWYLDDETSKPALRIASLKKGRKRDTPLVSLQQLKELGVVYFNINLNDFSIVKQLVKERLYKHTDEVHISQTCKDDTFLERWFQEHYNEDEQIRIVIDGSCYFDVRSKQDKWIRIHAKVGDLFVFAPGLYHRGTLDEDDYVALYRLFRDSPRFAPFFRSDARAESQKVRLNYLMSLKKGNVATELGFR
ncbi:1,2-Dihydroxy-3-keto-5-methylthiopentene dioxygenase [Trypanosoma conorhini]|uniref:1,2-Dihydroxy-3-keto-5-methylthiopentene dioxygenase n=1 Tax=Trypanosoma conorhini TaxID=83891 RepID=A0A422PLN6_9TRYP|nr:1,2-Dihydroxy-3-keto-5-methylthiopentene dioxygenase [Trypanosoma conorhini]RNF18630.1 1,2-Dihydroxy-3-keto-5-methylthiopentene dioxygenase [Trypanosoma conorhini]